MNEETESLPVVDITELSSWAGVGGPPPPAREFVIDRSASNVSQGRTSSVSFLPRSAVFHSRPLESSWFCYLLGFPRTLSAVV
jgi:hypothetical protein